MAAAAAAGGAEDDHPEAISRRADLADQVVRIVSWIFLHAWRGRRPSSPSPDCGLPSSPPSSTAARARPACSALVVSATCYRSIRSTQPSSASGLDKAITGSDPAGRPHRRRGQAVLLHLPASSPAAARRSSHLTRLSCIEQLEVALGYLLAVALGLPTGRARMPATITSSGQPGTAMILLAYVAMVIAWSNAARGRGHRSLDDRPVDRAVQPRLLLRRPRARDRPQRGLAAAASSDDGSRRAQGRQ